MHSSTSIHKNSNPLSIQWSEYQFKKKTKKNLCDIKKELGREENQTFFLSILLYGSD